jgi:sugar O-acyltransferase (sialic acid O-acetyltransferase NeuD family)
VVKSMKMLLYGYGGHGRVLADSLEQLGNTIVGVFDDDPALACPYLFLGAYSPDQLLDLPILLAIGNNQRRKKLSEKLSHPAANLVHSSAVCSKKAAIGAGTVVLHRAIVQTAVAIGKFVIINSGAIIEHDCRLHDFVHVAPGAVLCGGVVVGEGSLIGAAAVILPGISIGKNCVVAAGAVVAKSVGDGQKVAGNPARLL